MSANLLRHHLIAIHGEMDGHHWHWGLGPDLPCFVPGKDISIPPSCRREAPVSVHVDATARDLLAVFIGAGEMRASLTHDAKRAGRALMLKHWGRNKDDDIKAYTHLPYDQFLRSIRRAKFCPLFGGNSPWTTRLVEAILNGCVPVIFSSWLPPFSRLLRWEEFSVRIPTLALVPQLKTILQAQPYQWLAANLPFARSALWYRTEPSDRTDRNDLLPFLLIEMQLVLRTAAVHPLEARARDLLGLPLQNAVFYDDDERLHLTYPLNRDLPDHVAKAVKKAAGFFGVQYRGGVTLVTNRSAQLGRRTCEVVIRCVPMDRNGHSYFFGTNVSFPYAPSANLTVRTQDRARHRALANLMTLPYYGPLEGRCKTTGTSMCSRGESIRQLKLNDPISLTQNPPKS